MSETPERRLSWQQRAMLRVVPPVTAAVLRLLAATLRYEEVNEEGGYADEPGRTGIWCFWHRCLLLAACRFQHRPRTTLLISASFDGELIARTIHRLGYQTVRGSSSRAGAGGFRALLRALRSGEGVVLPGDGPRGPAYVLKPGVTALSRMSGLPVWSFYLHPQHAWRLRSWDGLLVPRPFSRVAVVWGRPVAAPASATEEEPARLAVEATLERLRHRAEVHFAKRPNASH
jgi:lysophospholipid acyltransferase (LPLAT)-like uncharacterized protein